MDKTEILQLKSNKLHILTISDIYVRWGAEIRIDAKTIYNFKGFREGYVWTNGDDLNLGNVAQVLNDRDGTGLSGTYWTGEIPRHENLVSNKIYTFYDKYRRNNKAHSYYFDETFNESDDDLSDEADINDYDYEELELERYRNFNYMVLDEGIAMECNETPEYSDEEYSSDDDQKNIEAYNNIPIIFYLNIIPDLLEYDMKLIDKVEINDFYIYKVVMYKDSDCSDIGRAVFSETLINMMGDQAGIALYKNIGAFGNFDYYERSIEDYDWMYPNHYSIVKPM